MKSLIRRSWEASPSLVVVAALHLGLLVVFLAGWALDGRVIAGQAAWLKPAKFAVSIALYTGTLAWLLSYIEGRPRLVKAIAGVTSVGLTIEIVAMAIQAARGVRSHFNVGTPFDATVFSVMGTTILVVWVFGVVTAGLLWRQRLADDALWSALRFGLVISLAGAALGGLMPRPTPAQLEQMQHGPPPEVGAHAVGVADGGPGLPIAGWSTEGGDLRVPHFVGLHALQLLPLLSWALARRRRLSDGARAWLVRIAGVTLSGVVAALTWQALRGESVVAPGALTAGTLALALIPSALAAAVVVARSALREAPRPSAVA